MAKIKETFKKMFGCNAHRKTGSNLPALPVRSTGAHQGSTGTLEPASVTISAASPALPVEPPALPLALPVEPPALLVEPSALSVEPSLEHVDSTKRTDLEELWEIARGRFSKQGTITLPESIAQASLEDCLASFEQTADVFERDAAGKEKVRNKIQTVLEGVEAVSELLGEGVNIAFPPAKTIFTAVGTLAKAANKTIKKYDLMLELLDEIRGFVDRMNVHKKDHPIPDELKEIIVSFLAELLKAIVSLSSFMEANIAVSVLKEVCGQDDDINGAIQKLATLTRRETGMVSALTHHDVRKLLKGQKDAKEQELREKIRNWLSPPDPSTNHRFNCAARRGQETGNWFLQSPGFIAWRDERSSRPLWLYGKPGNGKSVLCSTVVDNIIAHCENKPSSGIAYFYFDFRDKAKLDLRGLLCSLIVQMLFQCATMPASIANLFSQHANGGMTAPVDRLEHVFSGLLDFFEHSYIIIDALDEPYRDVRKTELLPFLESVMRERCPSLHFMVTSRPESDIQLYMGSMNPVRVDISSGLVEADIRTHICHVLEHDTDLKLWETGIRKNIELSLTKRANGMFRWVDLQLQSLRSCLSEEDIEQALSNLPKDLDETYDRILSAIPDADVPRALRLLHFLAFSLRPLSVKELAETIAVNIERDSDPYVIGKRRLRRATDIFTILSGLVNRANDDDSTPVALAHFSVQEYLISDRIRGKSDTLSKYSLTEKSSHIIIAHTCLNYLLQFSTVDCLDGKSRADFPFAEYAAEYWTQHVRYNKDNTLEIGEAVLEPASKLMQMSGFAFCNWVRIYDLDNPWTGRSIERLSNIPHPLYYASLAGLYGIVRLLLEKGAEVNAQGGRCGNALQAASEGGHNATMQLLLEKGAEVNAQGGYYGNALQAASRSGNNATVQLLLEKGAEVNVQGGDYGTALQAASRSGNNATVQLLLEKGAKVNAQGGHYGNALQAASEGGHNAMVQLLLKKGAEVNAQGGMYGTALQAASEGGHNAMVQLLLEKGAEVNAQRGMYGTALQAASSRGHNSTVQLLLEKGAKVNAQGGHYGNALQAASEGGHNATVHLLLEKGAEVNVQGGIYGNALQAASWNGNTSTVQLLLEKGAEVNMQGGRYNNVLNAASEGGHDHIMKSLLQNGAIQVSTSSLGNNIKTPEEDSYDGKDAEIIPGEGEGIPGDDHDEI